MSDKDVQLSKRFSERALVLIALHVLLLVYSLSGFFSKSAAAQPFLSGPFIALYMGMIVILGVYAIGWQQILKRLPLTVAFANKAITIVWGIVWGVLFFGETVTWQMTIGAGVVIAGVVLFSIADGEEQRVMASAEVSANRSHCRFEDAGQKTSSVRDAGDSSPALGITVSQPSPEGSGGCEGASDGSADEACD